MNEIPPDPWSTRGRTGRHQNPARVFATARRRCIAALAVAAAQLVVINVPMMLSGSPFYAIPPVLCPVAILLAVLGLRSLRSIRGALSPTSRAGRQLPAARRYGRWGLGLAVLQIAPWSITVLWIVGYALLW